MGDFATRPATAWEIDKMGARVLLKYGDDIPPWLVQKVAALAAQAVIDTRWACKRVCEQHAQGIAPNLSESGIFQFGERHGALECAVAITRSDIAAMDPEHG